MKACSYCGRENSDENLQCQNCGTEFQASEAGPPRDRRSTEERQQDHLRNVAKKQRVRRCRCGATLHPVGARGAFPQGCVETVSAAVKYECLTCRHTVEIPALSTFVTYGVFSLIFLWCGLQFVDWQGRASFKESAIFFLIFASPGMLTTWIVLKAWRRRRDYPPIA